MKKMTEYTSEEFLKHIKDNYGNIFKEYELWPENFSLSLRGWYDIINLLCRDLKFLAEKSGEEIFIVQIKEKCGTARFYIDCNDQEIYSIAQKIKIFYEDSADATCSVTGKYLSRGDKMFFGGFPSTFGFEGYKILLEENSKELKIENYVEDNLEKINQKSIKLKEAILKTMSELEELDVVSDIIYLPIRYKYLLGDTRPLYVSQKLFGNDIKYVEITPMVMASKYGMFRPINLDF